MKIYQSKLLGRVTIPESYIVIHEGSDLTGTPDRYVKAIGYNDCPVLTTDRAEAMEFASDAEARQAIRWVSQYVLRVVRA